MSGTEVAYGLGGRPFWLVVAVMFVIVLTRSHATYWLGRAVTGGVRRASGRPAGPAWWVGALGRVRAWMSTRGAERALTTVHRFGPFAVAVAFVTVGLQTAILLAAGLLAMPYLRFFLASLVGAAAWALVWSTIGLGAVRAAAALVLHTGWAELVGVLLITAGAVVLVVRRRRVRPVQAD